jgi:hypothetical protein
MIPEISNQQAYPIPQTNDIFVDDSLCEGEDILSYKDSLWNALQTNLYIGFPPEEKEETHFFIQQQAKPFENLSYQNSGFDWFFIISLIFLSLLAIIRLRSVKIFATSYDALLKGKFMDNSYDNQNSSSKRLTFPLFTCSWIGISFLFYILMFFCMKSNYFDELQTDKNLILLFSFIFIAIWFAARFILLKLISVLFNMENVVSEYQYLLSRVDFILVILSFPFIFVYAYYGMFSFYGETYFLLTSIPLIFIFLIFIILIFHKMIKGWGIFRKKFRLHEYFLYLCTVEILPLLVFLKFAISTLRVD